MNPRKRKSTTKATGIVKTRCHGPGAKTARANLGSGSAGPKFLPGRLNPGNNMSGRDLDDLMRGKRNQGSETKKRGESPATTWKAVNGKRETTDELYQIHTKKES